MHKNNFGQTLKLQSAVVILNRRSRLSKSCLQAMYQCKFGVTKFTGSEDEAQKKLNLHFKFLNDGYHDNEATLKTRSKSPISYHHFILSQSFNT